MCIGGLAELLWWAVLPAWVRGKVLGGSGKMQGVTLVPLPIGFGAYTRSLGVTRFWVSREWRCGLGVNFSGMKFFA